MSRITAKCEDCGCGDCLAVCANRRQPPNPVLLVAKQSLDRPVALHTPPADEDMHMSPYSAWTAVNIARYFAVVGIVYAALLASCLLFWYV